MFSLDNDNTHNLQGSEIHFLEERQRDTASRSVLQKVFLHNPVAWLAEPFSNPRNNAVFKFPNRPIQ